jgi:hypothetical protein
MLVKMKFVKSEINISSVKKESKDGMFGEKIKKV